MLGIAAAVGVARLIQSLLFQVDLLEPSVYAGVTALYLCVAILACLVPSMRASRVDPLVALRPD